jgi:hypothetical protein
MNADVPCRKFAIMPPVAWIPEGELLEQIE